jgi:hypothetical protein
MTSGTNSLLEVETNSVYINYEKSTTEPNSPHYSRICNFEFDHHLESHKHVISIIMGFRDTGCYNYLPRICQIVDSTVSCEFLSFLNAYSGYHQISLAVDDKEKITFITSFGIFCYTKMTFGLKNGGATYKKCVHTVLKGQIRQNIEAYIDDIVVESEKHGNLLDDLKKTFDNLRNFKMMLNHKKCIFGVSLGKLLGYMVSSRRIDANPKKVEVIEKCNHLGLEKKSRSWQTW